MQRRKAWNGNAPKSEAEARRFLLDVTQNCIERFGLSKVGLSDVASAAGVTRQTVYRYFANADELFNAAAVLASGGLLEHMRERVGEREGLAERIVETLVVAIQEIPKDAHLSSIVRSGESFSVSAALNLGFIQEEMVRLAGGDPGPGPGSGLALNAKDRDELAEVMVRLLKSFLADAGPERSEQELRALLYRWLIPTIEEKLRAPSANRVAPGSGPEA